MLDQYQDYFIANNNYYVQDMGMTYFNINQDDNELLRDVEDGDLNLLGQSEGYVNFEDGEVYSELEIDFEPYVLKKIEILT